MGKSKKRHTIALSLIRKFPMQRLAITVTAEVVGERVTAKKPDQAVQLSDSVLEWCPREAPAVASLQFKCSLRSVGRTFLDIVSFVKLFQGMSQLRVSVGNRTHNSAVPVDLVQRGCFFDDLSLPFETMLLLPEAGLQHGVRRKDDVVFSDLLCVCVPVAAVPD